jgi:rod shape determining protein RodA
MSTTSVWRSPNATLSARAVQMLNLDPVLFGLLVALSALGMVVLYSSGQGDANLAIRQAIRLGIAFMALLIFAQIKPEQLRRWAPWLYAGGIVLLIAVALVGSTGKGAQRWLDLGVARIQPSEVMKLGLPLMLAWYFHDRPLPPRILHLLVSAAIVAVPVGLIARQPDLGTSLLIAASGAFVLFLAGLGWRLIGGLIALIAAAAPIVWTQMREYQQQRVLTFLNPENDPLGSGYHIIQSKIAIGSGGLYGKGWLQGTQSNLDFLPERSTDFIFAAFSEEFGLVGAAVLFSLYFGILIRGLYIAIHAQDTFSRLLAGSLALTFFLYLVVNVGMVSGLLPVVGVPLPLVSYGGTSMGTLMAAFGMMMAIHSHRKLLPT